MKNIFRNKYFLSGLVVMIAMGWYSQCKKENEYEEYRCKTKVLEVNSVIKGINTKANYMKVQVSNMDNWISLNISETKYKKGFPENYSYEIGDSIIKKSDSKEFMIKRDTNVAVYILDCND